MNPRRIPYCAFLVATLKCGGWIFGAMMTSSPTVEAFVGVPTSHRNTHHQERIIQVYSTFSASASPTQLNICSVAQVRKGVEIPLLDTLGSGGNEDQGEYRDDYVQPLPSTHLPDEMTTLHIYGLQVSIPVHQSIVQYAMDNPKDMGDEGTLQHTIGHIAWKPAKNKDDSLVGAIGCAAQILLPPGSNNMPLVEDAPSLENDSTNKMTVLCRGTYRFIVREIKQSIPFPIAIVDELPDDAPIDDPSTATTAAAGDSSDEEDEEDDDEYATLLASDLVRRTLQALQTYVDQQLEVTLRDMSPLEQSIVEDAGMPIQAQRQAAEETAAVWQVFQDYLVDLCPAPVDRYYTVAFMAAEMANLNNAVRREILRSTNGVERLRIILPVLEELVGMARARQVARRIVEPTSFSDETDSTTSGQELQVGTPTLPPWAKQIRKGSRLEYFWNEEYEWCAGTVVEDPVWIINEYVLTIKFDDGEIHRLPLEADEKARWRPAGPPESNHLISSDAAFVSLFLAKIERPDATSTSSLTQCQAGPSSIENIDWSKLGEKLAAEAKECAACFKIVLDSLVQSSTTAKEIVRLCDELDELVDEESLVVTGKLRRMAMELKRYELLVKLLRDDYDAYVATASFLSPSRIPRLALPNVQDVPYDRDREPVNAGVDENGTPLLADCELDSVEFKGSLLDKALLSIFRKLVTKNTGGVTSDTEGLRGLLDQGRTFMLQPGQTDEAQHKMVRDTLGGLMTPVLPPFYRIFMSGIVPKKLGTPWDGKQIGPWFYAPFLTSFVTPTFFAFLVGPSRINRRKDGSLGGLVVEKCQFLQESGCKGLCLHQCKLPAQQFFAEDLGLPLTVSPNFDTQECQWSFGEEPLPPKDDPSFPKGCLVGCESRKAVKGTYVDLCN